jgi:hypothetical protein
VEFHKRIGVPQWHAIKPKPQHTWTRLISCLIGFQAEGVTDRIAYQRDHWGVHDGQTCVIELSGIAANNLATKRQYRRTFLDDRLKKIGSNLQSYKPSLLVLYGKSSCCKTAWEYLTIGAVDIDSCFSDTSVRKLGETLVAWATHPANFGQKISDWESLGQELRHIKLSAA